MTTMRQAILSEHSRATSGRSSALRSMTRRIQEACKKQGLSLDDLADRAHFTTHNVARMLERRELMRVSELIALANALSLSLDEIVFGAKDDVDPLVVASASGSRSRFDVTIEDVAEVVTAVERVTPLGSAFLTTLGALESLIEITSKISESVTSVSSATTELSRRVSALEAAP